MYLIKYYLFIHFLIKLNSSTDLFYGLNKPRKYTDCKEQDPEPDTTDKIRIVKG